MELKEELMMSVIHGEMAGRPTDTSSDGFGSKASSPLSSPEMHISVQNNHSEPGGGSKRCQSYAPSSSATLQLLPDSSLSHEC